MTLVRYFDRKNIVLTGGSSGIGRRLAVRLYEAGANLFLLARRPGPLQEAVAEIERGCRRPDQVCRSFPVDVGDRPAVEGVMQEVLAQHDIDMLINNAGVACANYFEETRPEDFEEMIRINYLGTVWTTRLLVPHFKKRRAGHIANVSSLAGVLGIFGYAAYAPSKFAVMGFSDVLRNELHHFGVRVSVLLPPDTDTPQLAFENRTKPAETRAISGKVRTMDADRVARALLHGMAAGRYHIVPGLAAKFSCYSVRWIPSIVRWLIDRSAAGSGTTKDTKHTK